MKTFDSVIIIVIPHLCPAYRVSKHLSVTLFLFRFFVILGDNTNYTLRVTGYNGTAGNMNRIVVMVKRTQKFILETILRHFIELRRAKCLACYFEFLNVLLPIKISRNFVAILIIKEHINIF